MDISTTEVAVVLDCSGSMGGVRRDAISSFNAFVRQQLQVPGDCNLTVIMFNTKMELFYRGPVARCPKMTERDFRCTGMTALYDAMGSTTNDLLKSFMQTLQNDRPRVTIGVLTDGDENSSKDYDIHELAAIVSKAKQMGFVFVMIGMGVDLDEFQDMCSSLGIAPSHSRVLASNKDIGAAVGLLSGSVTSTRTGGDGSIGLVKYETGIADADDETQNPRSQQIDALDFMKRPSPWSHMKKD